MTQETSEVRGHWRYTTEEDGSMYAEPVCIEEDGHTPHFTIETRSQGVSLGVHDIADPFIRTTTVVGWPDLLRALFRGRLVIETHVNGCRPIIGAVTRLTRMTDEGVNRLLVRLDDNGIVEAAYRISQAAVDSSPELVTAYRRHLEGVIKEQGGQPDPASWSVEKEPATDLMPEMAVFRLRALCTTCSVGPLRTTVGLVCQTCGKDYGADAGVTR